MPGAVERVLQAGLTGPLLLVTFLLLSAGSPSDSGAASRSVGPTAHISVVNGPTARISDSPWQVAIASRKGTKGKQSPRDRVYCGGVLIAPRLVATAGHCVKFLKRPASDRIEVISGRTRLNDRLSGQVTRVSSAHMPRTPSGQLRFRDQNGSMFWDVALLVLRKPVKATPILLAGPDERGSWKPGQTARATGWGVTKPRYRTASKVLREARHVMLADRVCRSGEFGDDFDSRLMACAGAPGGSGSTCYGDSGGPLVAPVDVDGTAEFRLVGLTSFGDDSCRGNQPSVFTRVAEGPIMRWITATALNLTGSNVSGSGGSAPTPPKWCRVPRVWGLTLSQARTLLNQNRCGLGPVAGASAKGGKAGTISAAARYPGWLAPDGFRLKVWVRR